MTTTTATTLTACSRRRRRRMRTTNQHHEQHRHGAARHHTVAAQQLLLALFVLCMTTLSSRIQYNVDAARSFLQQPRGFGIRLVKPLQQSQPSGRKTKASPPAPARLVSSALEGNDVYDDDADNSMDHDNDRATETAFFRAHSPNDVTRMRQISYAFQPRAVVPATELDHLESSLAMPCAARRHVSPRPLPLAARRRVASTSSTTKQRTAIASSSSNAPTRGGGAAAAAAAGGPLTFWENMVCGAISRSVAQTMMHPANTMKTILQSSPGPVATTLSQLIRPSNWRLLTRGAGANFLLSVPHGAANFAVLELVRRRLDQVVSRIPVLQEKRQKFGPAFDFLSSATSTVVCSVVSTPQMMITDNIMAGNYPNLGAACVGLARSNGWRAFYRGWGPGLAGKIPSYALTWTIFQQFKAARQRISPRDATDFENTIMGCMASAVTVSIMIPMDTIKTRIVTQAGRNAAAGQIPYKGIIDCAVRVYREEGMHTFYRGLPPRLISVVPMIGIQFGMYEFMKKVMIKRRKTPLQSKTPAKKNKKDLSPQRDDDDFDPMLEASMEVASSPEHPYPAPRFRKSQKPSPETKQKKS